MAKVHFKIPKQAFVDAATRSGELLPDEIRKAVARGWSVIPQEEQADGRKKPLVKWKPFQMDAPGMTQVQRWYKQWPDELYAIILGQVSGVVVFDFDGPDGIDALNRSRLVPYVETPGRGGGAHVYVKAPRYPVRTRQKTGIPGVELKAEGATATFYGERVAGWYKRVSAGRIYKPEELPREYRELLAEATPTPTPPTAAQAGEAWPPQRCAAWAMRKLYDDVPIGQLHNGRASTAHFLAIQLRDVPEDLAVEAMKLFHEQAGDLNSEGAHEPYPLTEAMETLKHNRLNIPAEWTPGPFADDGHAGTDEEVAKELKRLRVRESAREQLQQEKAARDFVPPPSTASLRDELAIKEQAVHYSVAKLHPQGTNALLAAAFKVGKTTLLANLFRSLLDGDAFLGTYAVDRPAGGVAYWNYEMTEAQFRGWLRKLGITNIDDGAVLHLRGYRLPLLAAHVEDWAVQWLQDRRISTLVLDPFARAYRGDENNNPEVGRFLDALDVVKRRAGVHDLYMGAHFGRAAQAEGDEHVRGATVLDDWADVRWLYRKGVEQSRYFRAEGRDVHVPEQRLSFDATTLRLTAAGGSMREDLERKHVREAVHACSDTPGLSKTALRQAISGKTDDKEGYIALAIASGYITKRLEGAQKISHYITDTGKSFLLGKAVRVKEGK